MRRAYHVMVAKVEADGLAHASVDGLAEALGGRVRRLNGGTWLDVEVEDDPCARERARTRGAGGRRHALPEGSPLLGMDEEAARRWASRHTPAEVESALGVSRTTYYRRVRSGRLLPGDE